MKDKFFSFFNYHIYEKWKFVYFELNIEQYDFSKKQKNDSFLIRKAVFEDIKKIERDLYPYFSSKQEFEKKYIPQLNKKGISCFIAEKDNNIIHCFLLFEKALNSPLIKTPFNMSLISSNHAFLSSAFTAPVARGIWILPLVVEYIFKYLKTYTKTNKVILLVHKDTPGAVIFFQRMGFTIIENAISPSFFLDKILSIFIRK